MPSNLNPDEIYKPILIKKLRIDGIAGATIPDGESGPVIQELFIASHNEMFETIANNIVTDTFGVREPVNSLLVIIKPDDSAKIYKSFPFVTNIRSKRDLEAGTVVFKEDVFDIVGVSFSDAIFAPDIEDGDKVLWLFRENWTFGLYFNFSRKLKKNDLPGVLGHWYKMLFFQNIYSFVSKENSFDLLFEDGWFPFIQLIGKDFEKLITFYREDRKNTCHVADLLTSFNRDKLDSFTKYWWKQPQFKEKRKILEAGIEAFLLDSETGFINCISTLYPQIEGIVGSEYFLAFGRKASFRELKEHIGQKAEAKFTEKDSMGFPKEFYKYIDSIIFQNFDLSTGKVDLSRHTTSHGYAKSEEYTKAKALQAILVLDQICFYSM